MEKIAIIDPLGDERWDQFVQNHPFGWICHLGEWKRLLENSYSHMKGYYIILVDNYLIKAALPIYMVKSWIMGKRLVSVPYATIFDPLISNTGEMSKLFDAAMKLSIRLQTESIEIRSFLSSTLIKNERLGLYNFYKHHFLALDNSLEQIKKSFDRTCVQQRINRALESNLNFKYVERESDLMGFYQIYLRTRKRLSLPPQPYKFIKMLWTLFSPSKKIKILLAEKRHEIIAGLILLLFKGRVSIEYAVSDERFKNSSPIHFLFWEAIQNAYNEGFQVIDFGRTSPLNIGLMNFKKRWGARVVDLPQFFYPSTYCNNMEAREKSMGYAILKSFCRKAPTSAYIKFGNFCYHHLG